MTKHKYGWKTVSLLLLMTTLGSLLTSQGAVQTAVQAARPSSIFLKVDKVSYLSTSTLKASVIVDPAGENINAVGMHMDFDPVYLSVDKVEYATSVCQFIIPEYRDNQKGALNTACGSPDIQATTSMKVMDITFTRKQVGWAKINLAGSKVLAADGLGTDILDQAEFHRIFLEK
jgi:hypothetical protein